MSVLCNHEAAARWKGSLPVDAVVAGMDSQCVPSAIEDIRPHSRTHEGVLTPVNASALSSPSPFARLGGRNAVVRARHHRYGRRVPDALFAHPRLAPLYDAFDGDRDDLSAYLDIADELGAESVLDVGCGTGSLAILLASSGRRVVAVDPAQASLDVAKAKDTTAAVTWIHGDATTLPALSTDLATMTGNVAQVFLTDHEWAQTLQGIRAALAPHGNLVFETRRPERRAWEEWAVDFVPVTLDIPGIGAVQRSFEVTHVSLPLVSFRYTYSFLDDGTVITSDSTLRFRTHAEVVQSLTAHGYSILDVREAPDRLGRELVFIAERTTT